MTTAHTPLAVDDPRHGTHAGFVAGCRCVPCAAARRRFQKSYELRLLAGERMRYNADEVAEVIGPWIRMGFTQNAIRTAAGLSPGHPLLGTRVKASSYRALASLTDADFDPASVIPGDLTKRRIYSLMAAGHQLQAMPINACGWWRTRDRIACGIARDIRDYYAANEFKIGPSRITATKARNAGHVPPMAWDDPGTLAWPNGKPERIIIGPRSNNGDVDAVVVERRLDGDRTVRTTYAERCEIVRAGNALGLNDSEIAKVTGFAARTVLRVRSELGIGAAVDAARNPIRKDGAA